MNDYKQFLQVRPSKTGRGVFTNVDIPLASKIFEVLGPVMKTLEVPDMNAPALLQIGADLFIGASGDVDDYINHSCVPNCMIQIFRNRAFVLSLQNIETGSELTFDYSTTSTDTKDMWSMKCQCGHRECRGVISGYQYLDETLRKRYKGIAPQYAQKYANHFVRVQKKAALL